MPLIDAELEVRAPEDWGALADSNAGGRASVDPLLVFFARPDAKPPVPSQVVAPAVTVRLSV